MKPPLHPSIKDIPIETVLYALADPVRMSIVKLLASNGEMTCGQFCQSANKGKSTMTHHFKVLRDSGVIFTRVEGREHFTSLRLKELDSKFPGLIATILQSAGGKKAASVR